MNICYICSEYPPGPHGGIGTFTQVLATALAGAGHQVRVVGIYDTDYPAPDREDDRGVMVWRLREPQYRFGWLVARLKLFRMVSQWARSGEIDLIEVPDAEGWAAGWPALPVPVVARLQGAMSYFAREMGQRGRRLAFFIERASLRRADFYCSTSHYTEGKTRQLFGIGAADAILHNVVSLSASGGEGARDKNLAVFTGTLTPKKGVISLMRAWVQVVRACPDARLHVFGKDGRTDQGISMMAYLRAEMPGDVASTVQFRGGCPRDEVLGALMRARVAVFPSYAEAFALAPLESMAAGCATVYSTRGSGPELIGHERDGLLIDPDQPTEIAATLIRVFTDDGLAQRLGEAGRRRVQEQFSIERSAADNEGFYERCVRDFKTRSTRRNLQSVKVQ
jgi:glycosyltransferase involved in cell wall biosynthesis